MYLTHQSNVNYVFIGTGPGRLTFIMSSKSLELSKCDLQDCIVTQLFVGNPQLVQCNSCMKYIHIHACDRNVKKKKNGLAVIPKVYQCPNCNPKKSKQPKKAGQQLIH